MIPLGSEPDPAQKEEAKKLLADGLGKAEVEVVASFVAPLFWTLRTDDRELLRGGSAFFLNAGQGVFGVTAAHVVEKCFRDCRSDLFVGCFVGGQGRSVSIKLEDRIIDADADLDTTSWWVTRLTSARD